MRDKIGAQRAGDHFIAITDPDTPLTDIAERYHFRETFLNDPNIGGRYAALSLVGLVPAALIGMDIALLLNRATRMAANCKAFNPPAPGDNIGARLGAVLGELAKAGRDKVTVVASAQVNQGTAPAGPSGVCGGQGRGGSLYRTRQGSGGRTGL